MSLARSNHTQKQILPTPWTVLEKKKRELTRYHEKFEPKHSKIVVKHTLTTAPNSPTRDHSPSPPLESRMKSSRLTTATLSSPLRPKSQRIERCRDQYTSPLSVIRTRHCLPPSLPPSRPLRTDFLRKGSAVDKAIIRNILMSKLSSRSRPTLSYCDSASNAVTAGALRTEIPLGLRDVVGAEEMLRMSHIILGVDFKTCSLGKLTGSALIDIRQERLLRASQEEESPMLRSIQRW